MNIRFVISAVYSVATLCGSVSELPEKIVQKETFIGPVYRECEEAAEKTDAVKNAILSNLYLPGFDVNSDGAFDETDSLQINETRKQKKKRKLPRKPQGSQRNRQQLQNRQSLSRK